MYGPVDFLVAQEIIHVVGRKQAQQEGQEISLPEEMSLVGRLISRLPLWTPNESFALDASCDEPSLNTVQCE